MKSNIFKDFFQLSIAAKKHNVDVIHGRSPREIYSPGELISPRDLSRVSEAEAGEVVVGVEHVEEVITRALASLGSEVANTELLHIVKMQMFTDIRCS